MSQSPAPRNSNFVPGKMVGIFLQIQVFFHELKTAWVEKLPWWRVEAGRGESPPRAQEPPRIVTTKSFTNRETVGF